MRFLIVILSVFVIPISILSQSISKQKGDLNCVYKKKYSLVQRNQFYPFNISDTVKLISFRFHRNNYPVKESKLITDSLIELKTLTKPGISELTDILYNNFYKKDPNYGLVTQCYFPRNAILFYDKEGNLKEYIFICFSCDRHKESSEKIEFGDECNKKMEKLRMFFIKTGLKFGTDKKIGFYPGEDQE